MKLMMKLSPSGILVSIVVFLIVLYLSPRLVEETNWISGFLNIRTFTEAYATDISSCSNLDQPGTTYLLTANIINSVTSYCMSISANNVILDCQGHMIDGDDLANYGIYIDRSSSQTTNITIRNCILSDWKVANIYLYNVNGNNLTDINSTSSPDSGFFLHSSSFTTISNSTATSNSFSGFYLYSSNNNTLSNSTATFNSYGFELASSNFTTISNSTATSNSYGFYLESSSNNTISNSGIQNHTNYGIYLYDAVSNSIYNNLFNNTNNFYFDGIIANYWNTTKQTGTRIYSSGTEIGGNYWTNSTGNGYSDTCTDDNTDGFCDNTYTLATNNIDYLPLSNKFQYKISTDYVKVQVMASTMIDSSKWDTSFTITQGQNYILRVIYDNNEENITINTKVNKSVYIGFFDTNLIGSETTYKDKFQKSYTLP